LLLEVAAGGIRTKISVANASGLLDGIAIGDETIRYRVLIAATVQSSGTSLTDIVEVGPIGAATIIGYTKDISRFPTKGHYATYNATAPIEASSGGNKRHSLNL
jgi:transposase